ncbi:MAG: ATP-binding cassette domain-containing protein [Planctomycetes bacterium]|nr:ATP-binding cassette domain-containing protein [Planctomycetota bacterium]
MRDPLWRLEQVQMPGRLGPADITINAGITALLGRSGSGKTTLCNLLVGFEQPRHGAIARTLPADGRLPLYWSPLDALWPHLDVAGHLAAVAPRSPRLPAARILEALALSHRAGAHPRSLSAGERTRVGVARALASEAAVLVLDEPFAHLDSDAMAACWRCLSDFTRATGSSLVYATHDPEWVVGCADHAVCLHEGRVIAAGPVEELYHRPADAAVAACFGAANWFDRGQEQPWFAAAESERIRARGGCVRPEDLALAADDHGPGTVRDSSFHGAFCATEIQLGGGGAQRRFLHRPAAPALAAGTRVMLKLLFAVAVIVFFAAGCSSTSAGTGLALHPTCFTLPNDGIVQPAPRGLGPTRAGEVLVLDTIGRVLTYRADGTLARTWRMPAWDVGRPEGVVELTDGRVAVADTHYHRVVTFNADGTVAGTFGKEGPGPGEFIYPVSVTVDPSGNLYVAEYGGNDRVQKFDKDGTFVCAFGAFGTTPGSFQRPQRIVWHGGEIYIADAMNDRIQIFSDSGTFVGVVGGDHPPELHFPYGLWLDPAGVLWVGEYSGNRVTKLARDGTVLGRYGHAGRDDGGFATPWSLTGDTAGNIWVADTGNRRLVRLAP